MGQLHNGKLEDDNIPPIATIVLIDADKRRFTMSLSIRIVYVLLWSSSVTINQVGGKEIMLDIIL